MGAVPSPFDCYLANRGLRTLHVRMRAHAENALAVAKYLEGSPLVENAIYPGKRREEEEREEEKEEKKEEEKEEEKEKGEEKGEEKEEREEEEVEEKREGEEWGDGKERSIKFFCFNCQ